MNLDHIPEHLKALAKITHINELVIASPECEQMLNEFYDKMLQHAEDNGLKVSELFPQDQGI